MQWKSILPFLKNKYFIATILFVLWMLFFDENNVFNQWDNYMQLQTLKDKEQFLDAEIAASKTEYKQLSTNKLALETEAREKHLMKKDDEDLFVIVRDTVEKK